MAELTDTISQDAQRLQEQLQPYFVHSVMACPYGLPFQALYNQALFDAMPDYIMASYLASGYRRNGNVIYSMQCPDCEACVPLRLEPEAFTPDRNQKRTWKRNRDISVEIGPPSCCRENLSLLGRFLDGRYPGRDSVPLDYYTGFFLNHITSTLEFRYRAGSQLTGVAIVDVGSDWLNVVFFYFDPAAAKRSPGTYNILYLIDFCRRQGIQFIYLGYWIEAVKAMRYKARFKPHQILHRNTWRLVSG